MSKKVIAKGTMTARQSTNRFYTHDRHLSTNTSPLLSRLLQRSAGDVAATPAPKARNKKR